MKLVLENQSMDGIQQIYLDSGLFLFLVESESYFKIHLKNNTELLYLKKNLTEKSISLLNSYLDDFKKKALP